MSEIILAQNCQKFDNFNFEFSMSHHNAHYHILTRMPLEKGLRPLVLAINVSKFLPASRCSKRQLGIRSCKGKQNVVKPYQCEIKMQDRKKLTVRVSSRMTSVLMPLAGDLAQMDISMTLPV